ncbi:ComEC/Rec2 family competence protein [Microlunatus sp. Gsoil 973]|uniref:ComEC/Rec2 family competence protein n=1 Tax=Microlunatus sp. Gsoil 973 TaxID=2672569 RepID=UPI0012B47851|nr:ComEC/Rec2 family competence protein [Microlunatus sp. Gsoil 973]QGN31751.1 MBL fold metallo-hydrolase [Microlunatus sp. Gsoil 973]
MTGALTERGTGEPAAVDLRLAPVAAAGWLGAWLGTGGRFWLLLVGAAGLLLLITPAIVRRSWWAAATAAMLAGTLIIGWAHLEALQRSSVGRLAGSGAVVRAEVRLTGDPRIRPAQGIRPAFLTVRADVVWISGRGQTWRERAPVLVTASADQLPAWRRFIAGNRVRTGLRLQPPDPGSDIAAIARVRAAPVVTGRPGPADRAVERVRSGLRGAVARGSPEARALVPSLVLGDTSAITDAITEDFLSTGLTHLTAVSGANLALMLAFLVVLSRWIGVRGWWLRLVGLAGVIMFVALCRAEPSVLRAAAMGLVSLAALGMSGRSTGMRGLFVAMIMLLVGDPWLGRSPGFALSVLASGGIVWWARRWAAALQTWLPRVIAESIAVPLSAHLATLPVATAMSGQVSMVGIVTNALAGPFVGPATILGFSAAGLSQISPFLAGLVGRLACWSAQPVLWIAHIGAALPGAIWIWPAGVVSLGLLSTICLTLASAMPQVLRRPWLAGGLSLLMIIGIIRAPVQPGWPPKDWLLIVCDVGQGDGMAVNTGPGQAIVIDSGPEPKPMRTCLDQLDVRTVPLLIFTHFHADHVGGLSGVLAGRRVNRIWVSPYASPPGGAEDVSRAAARLQIPIAVPTVGTEAQVGPAALRVVGPIDRRPNPLVIEDGRSSMENNLSIATMITIDGERLLLTGDVEPEEQRRIVASGMDLDADVLKVPHHGSSRQDAEFIAATHARVAIASAGVHNDYGHPAAKTVRLLRSDGMTTLCTCWTGSVAVIREGAGIGVVTQHRVRQ